MEHGARARLKDQGVHVMMCPTGLVLRSLLFASAAWSRAAVLMSMVKSVCGLERIMSSKGLVVRPRVPSADKSVFVSW